MIQVSAVVSVIKISYSVLNIFNLILIFTVFTCCVDEDGPEWASLGRSYLSERFAGEILGGGIAPGGLFWNPIRLRFAADDCCELLEPDQVIQTLISLPKPATSHKFSQIRRQSNLPRSRDCWDMRRC